MDQSLLRQLSDSVSNLQQQGATDAEISDFLKGQGVDPRVYVYEVNRLAEAGGSFEPHGPVEGAVAALGQNGAMGFADEISGAITALGQKAAGADAPLSDLYRQSRAKADLANIDYASRHPWAASFAGAGGSMLLPGAGARAGLKPLLAAGTTGLERFFGGVFAGGAAGAAAGYGNAHPSDRASGAATGAAGGAIIGGGIPIVAEAATKLRAPLLDLSAYVRDVAGRLLGGAGRSAAPEAAAVAGAPQRASQLALEHSLDAMERDGNAPIDFMAAQQSNRAIGAPMSVAEMGGPNVKGLARATVTLPGRARAIADGNLSAPLSVEQARPRMEARVEEMAGMPAVDTDGLLAQRKAADRAASEAAYASAYAQGPLPVSEKLLGVLQSAPAYRAAHDRARAALNDAGRASPIEALFDDKGRLIRSPTVEDVDVIKKGLDRRLYDASGRATMTDSQSADKIVLKELGDARKRLLDAVDPVAPDYAKARAQFGDQLEVQRAVELGQDALAMAPREIAREVRGMSEAARTEFRRAAVDAVRLRLLQAADRGEHTNLAKEIFGTGAGSKREALAAIFGNGPAFAQFEQQMRNELARYATRNFVFAGSQTANKAAEAAELAGDVASQAAAAVATGHPAGAAPGIASRMVGWAGNKMRAGTWEGTRADIAEGLFKAPDAASDADAFLQQLEALRQQRIARAGRLPFYTASGASAANASQQ